MIGSVLKELLEKRSMNVNELSRKTGVSAQTLYSIIKRDSMKIDFEVLLKICSALDVSVEAFYGQTGSVSGEEWELIRMYRALDERGKGMLIAMAQSELRQMGAKPD